MRLKPSAVQGFASVCSSTVLTCCGVQGPSCTLASGSSLLADTTAASRSKATSVPAAARGAMPTNWSAEENGVPGVKWKLGATRAGGRTRAGITRKRAGEDDAQSTLLTGAHGDQRSTFLGTGSPRHCSKHDAANGETAAATCKAQRVYIAMEEKLSKCHWSEKYSVTAWAGCGTGLRRRNAV